MWYKTDRIALKTNKQSLFIPERTEDQTSSMFNNVYEKLPAFMSQLI